MTPIKIKNIAESMNFVNSLELNEKLAELDKIHQSQPHAFLTVLSLSQDGVSMEKVEHACWLSIKSSVMLQLVLKYH